MSIPWVQGKQQVTLQKSTSLEQYCTNYHTNLRATKISQSINSGSRNRMPQDSTILGQKSQDIEASWNIRRIGKHWDIFDQNIDNYMKSLNKINQGTKTCSELEQHYTAIEEHRFQTFYWTWDVACGCFKADLTKLNYGEQIDKIWQNVSGDCDRLNIPN